MKKIVTAAVLVALTVMMSGCASMLNLEMARSERQAAILRAGQFNEQQTVSINLLELRNITEAPLWRTLLCAGLDIGTGVGLYALADEEGWLGLGDDSSTDKRAVKITAGRDVVYVQTREDVILHQGDSIQGE